MNIHTKIGNDMRPNRHVGIKKNRFNRHWDFCTFFYFFRLNAFPHEFAHKQFSAFFQIFFLKDFSYLWNFYAVHSQLFYVLLLSSIYFTLVLFPLKLLLMDYEWLLMIVAPFLFTPVFHFFELTYVLLQYCLKY